MKLALHSVSYSGTAFEGQCCLSLEKTILKAAELGFDAVELMAKRPHASLLDLDEQAQEDIKRLVKEKGLELSCLAAYNDFADPNPYHREVQLYYTKRLVNLASSLGVKIVRVFASAMGNMHVGASYAQQWKWVVEHMREAAKCAEEHGVILALQNHSPIVQSYKSVLDMIKEVDSDNLKVALDAELLNWADEPYAEAVHEVGDLIVYSTTGDHISRPGATERTPAGVITRLVWRGVPLGEGGADWRAFIGALKEIGYDGFLAYEICGPMTGGGEEQNLDSIARTSLQYMRKILAEVGYA